MECGGKIASAKLSACIRRSEEHTSDSSHMSISYAVFCLKKKKPLLRALCHRKTVPLWTTYGAQQNRIGLAGHIQCLVRQAVISFVQRSSTNEAGIKRKLQIKFFINVVQDFFGFCNDFRTYAVTRQKKYISGHDALPNLGKPGHFGFFYNDTATTEIYTLSLHDALPI